MRGTDPPSHRRVEPAYQLYRTQLHQSFHVQRLSPLPVGENVELECWVRSEVKGHFVQQANGMLSTNVEYEAG